MNKSKGIYYCLSIGLFILGGSIDMSFGLSCKGEHLKVPSGMMSLFRIVQENCEENYEGACREICLLKQMKALSHDMKYDSKRISELLLKFIPSKSFVKGVVGFMNDCVHNKLKEKDHTKTCEHNREFVDCCYSKGAKFCGIDHSHSHRFRIFDDDDDD